MPTLAEKIKQAHFESPQQEALLNLLAASAHVRERLAKIFQEFGLTSGQYNVLRILKGIHPQGHPRCEISARMIEKAPDVTRLVDRLVKAGLVERLRAGEDRRHSLSRITSQGIDLLARIQPRIQAFQNIFGELLTEEKCRQLSQLCELIYSNSFSIDE